MKIDDGEYLFHLRIKRKKYLLCMKLVLSLYLIYKNQTKL